jgi:hypothetical protein
MLERSWIASQLAASQEGLSSMKSVFRKKMVVKSCSPRMLCLFSCALIHFLLCCITQTGDGVILTHQHPMKSSCSQIECILWVYEVLGRGECVCFGFVNLAMRVVKHSSVWCLFLVGCLVFLFLRNLNKEAVGDTAEPWNSFLLFVYDATITDIWKCNYVVETQFYKSVILAVM